MTGDRELGATLCALARGAIASAFGLPDTDVRPHDALAGRGATFVTLRQDGELRGCVGTVEPFRALADDVRANARSAAFDDPRFAPLARDELPRTSVEVSLLSAATRLEVAGEDDLVARLAPGVDGLVLEHARARATFLPQVWESLADPREFVRALKRKAGLPSDFWSPEIRVARYTVAKWAEADAEHAGRGAPR